LDLFDFFFSLFQLSNFLYNCQRIGAAAACKTVRYDKFFFNRFCDHLLVTRERERRTVANDKPCFITAHHFCTKNEILALFNFN